MSFPGVTNLVTIEREHRLYSQNSSCRIGASHGCLASFLRLCHVNGSVLNRRSPRYSQPWIFSTIKRVLEDYDHALFTIDRRSRPLKRFKAEPSGKWVGRFLFTKYDGVFRLTRHLGYVDEGEEMHLLLGSFLNDSVSFKLLPLQPFIPSVLNIYHGLITRVACPSL